MIKRTWAAALRSQHRWHLHEFSDPASDRDLRLAAIVFVLADLGFDGFPSEILRVVAYMVFVAGAALMF